MSVSVSVIVLVTILATVRVSVGVGVGVSVGVTVSVSVNVSVSVSVSVKGLVHGPWCPERCNEQQHLWKQRIRSDPHNQQGLVVCLSVLSSV